MFDIRRFLEETYIHGGHFDDPDMILRINDVPDNELRARFRAVISTMQNSRPGSRQTSVIVEIIEKRYDDQNPMTLKDIGETLSEGQRSQETMRRVIEKVKRRFNNPTVKNFMVSGATRYFMKLK